MSQRGKESRQYEDEEGHTERHLDGKVEHVDEDRHEQCGSTRAENAERDAGDKRQYGGNDEFQKVTSEGQPRAVYTSARGGALAQTRLSSSSRQPSMRIPSMDSDTLGWGNSSVETTENEPLSRQAMTL